jgi:hypothetical protein
MEAKSQKRRGKSQRKKRIYMLETLLVDFTSFSTPCSVSKKIVSMGHSRQDGGCRTLFDAGLR